MQKFHYTYKIINKVTDEFYIGVRSCACPIEKDVYMGSSSIWSKNYIKTHRSELDKIILNTFCTRQEANIEEVKLLLEVQHDPLCINQYFGYTPDVTGRKQSEEHIQKRKLVGPRNGMYNKHHSAETKKLMSEKLAGRIVSEETKLKISNFHKGKVYNSETRQKISKARQKIRHIVNIITGESWDVSITDFAKMFPDQQINPSSMRKAANDHCIYKKTYKITDAASNGDISSKLGENGENPEVDNPVGSVGNE